MSLYRWSSQSFAFSYSTIVKRLVPSFAFVRFAQPRFVLFQNTGSLTSGIRLLDNKRTPRFERVKKTRIFLSCLHYWSCTSRPSLMWSVLKHFPFATMTLTYTLRFPFSKWLFRRISAFFDIPFRVPSYLSRDCTHFHVFHACCTPHGRIITFYVERTVTRTILFDFESTIFYPKSF